MSHEALAPETKVNSAKNTEMINVERRINIAGQIATKKPVKDLSSVGMRTYG